MFLVLTKTVGKKSNLQIGTVHDWSRRLLRTYAAQWGPQETWCRFIDETEAEDLAKGLPAPSVDVTVEENIEEVVELTDEVPSLDDPDEIEEDEKELA
jgi:hypothetical protein